MKHLRLIVMTTVILGITWSCQQEEGLTPRLEEQIFLSKSDIEGMTKLGKQLENPYSVQNMKKAWETLNQNGRTSGENVEITTTHLYIRFKPKNEDELSILKRDSTLVLYDYPLDYKIEQTGDFYHDPEVPINQPTYQYSAVTVDEKLPRGVEYELLAELFIPDEEGDEDKNTNGRIASIDLVESLVDEALRITNNWEEPLAHDEGSHEHTQVNARGRRCRWRPAGRITVQDDILGETGVHDVEVRARRWFTTHEGKTDTQGRFSCNGRFRRDANYSIKWDKYHFSIRKGLIQQYYNGPKRRGDWNLNITGGLSKRYAIIFQAARDYYYGNRLGLKSPPTNSTLKPQMKLRYEDSEELEGGGCVFWASQ